MTAFNILNQFYEFEGSTKLYRHSLGSVRFYRVLPSFPADENVSGTRFVDLAF